MNKLIFGCGYLGRRVAERWLAAGDEVWAVTRSERRAAEFDSQGIRPVVWDLTSDCQVALPAMETVLFAVGFDRASGHSVGEVYVGGLRRALDQLPTTVRRFLYISSTGVYGQDDGSWVDEHSPCEPVREGGRACLEAERLLSTHPLGRRAVVLRLAGLYGPGRIPHRADLQAGRPLAVPASGYLNLIHVEDAVEVVLAAEARAADGRLYVVSDGSPAPRADYYAELARQCHAPPPQFIPPAEDSHRAGRAASDKRIANRRMLDELRVSLRYPTYREGLAAIVANGGG